MSYSYGGGGQPAAYGAPAAGYAPAPQAYGQPAAGPYGGGAMGQAAHGAYGQPPMQSAQGYGGVSTAPYQSAPAAAPPASGPDSVAMWFRAIDTDASGFLDARELQQALAKGNLHYGLTDTDQMVRAFDTRGSRSLNVQEFQKLHEFLNSVTASFNYFDADRSRALTLSETVNALRHAGFNMDPPVVQAMFKRHDPNNSGTLSLDEYIRLCLFLQSCVRTFSAFDAQRAGRITLDFNQFVYAGSHIA